MVTPTQRERQKTPSVFNNRKLDLDELAAGQFILTPALVKSSEWAAGNAPKLQTADTIMNQLPLVGAGGSQVSPTPAARSTTATPRQKQSRPKKAKKAKQVFVIDPTADSNDESAVTSRQGTMGRTVIPYVSMDNSAWIGMMFTKSRSGVLEGVMDESELLWMNMDVEVGKVEEAEEVRRSDGGGGGEVSQRVYGY